MPWRSIQDEFGKFKWIDHTGKVYPGIPFSVEPDITSKHIFIASMMRASSRPPVLQDIPDVTCPSDTPSDKKRKEVVQMVFVLKLLTQSQQQGNDIQDEYKHKSRMVICGNFATWGEHSTTTTNLDAPLLRLMLSLACSKETTWSSIDITPSSIQTSMMKTQFSSRHRRFL